MLVADILGNGTDLLETKTAVFSFTRFHLIFSSIRLLTALPSHTDMNSDTVTFNRNGIWLENLTVCFPF